MMRELLVEAANILDVGEFEVLRRAYRNWHGIEAPPQELEWTYGQYLQASQLPPWAQHYARCVAHEFQAQQPAGCSYLSWLLLVFAGASWVSSRTMDGACLAA